MCRTPGGGDSFHFTAEEIELSEAFIISNSVWGGGGIGVQPQSPGLCSQWNTVLSNDWMNPCFREQSRKASAQVSSVAQSCTTLCNPMDCSTPGLPVHHQLPEFTQAHVHWVGDAIQPSDPLSSSSPSAINLSQHQGLFQWVSSSHQVAKVLEFQLQHQSFQCTPRTDLL